MNTPAFQYAEAAWQRVAAEDPMAAPHAGLAFETIELLGEGGMGKVLRVRDRRSGREAALKLGLSLDPKAEERFLREAIVTARLDHPAVPAVYETGRAPTGQVYMLMAVVHGRTLKELLQAGELDRRERLELLVRITEAVSAAHARGIIHRDLKPSNIMVGAHGEVLILDWGVARDRSEPLEVDQSRAVDLSEVGEQSVHVTSSGIAVGTPGYMSPEQARGDEVDGRSDVFSLGSILTELLVGRPAIDGATSLVRVVATLEGRFVSPREIDPSIPVELDALARLALESELEDRLPAAEDLAAELKSWLADEPPACVSETFRRRARRLARRHPARLLAGLVGVVLLTASLALGARLEQSRQARAEADRRAADARARADRIARLKARREAKAEALEAALLEARKTGLTRAVAKALDGVIAAEPEDRDTEFLLAAELAAAGWFKRARELFRGLVKADHRRPEALLWLHELNLLEADPRRLPLITPPLAELIKEREGIGAETPPSGPIERYIAAVIQARDGEPDLARTTLRELIKDAPRFTPARRLSGLLYMKENLAVSATRVLVSSGADRSFTLSAVLAARFELVSGNAFKARFDLKQAVQSVPNNALLLRELARCRARDKRPKSARSSYERMLEVRADMPGAAAVRAEILAAEGRAEEALALTRRELQSHPNDPALRDLLIRMLLGTKRTEEAMKALRAESAAHPEDPTPLITIGKLARLMKRGDAALAAFDEALARDRKNSEALVLKAEVLLDRKRTTLAGKFAREALAVDPRNAAARRILAAVLESRRDYSGADKLLLENIRRNGTDVAAIKQRIAMLKKDGRKREALEWLYTLLAADRAINLVTIHQQLTSLHLGLDEPQLAAGHARQVLLGQTGKNAASLHTARLSYGACLALAGRWVDALRPLSEAEAVKSTTLGAKFLGVAYRETGRLDESVELFRKLTKPRPPSMEAALAYIETLSVADLSPAAITNARNAITARPKNPGTHLTLARALMRLGETEEARAATEAGLACAPDNPSARIIAAGIFIDLDPERALKELEGLEPHYRDRPRRAIFRAIALDRLGRRAEAIRAWQSALAEDLADDTRFRIQRRLAELVRGS